MGYIVAFFKNSSIEPSSESLNIGRSIKLFNCTMQELVFNVEENKLYFTEKKYLCVQYQLSKYDMKYITKNLPLDKKKTLTKFRMKYIDKIYSLMAILHNGFFIYDIVDYSEEEISKNRIEISENARKLLHHNALIAKDDPLLIDKNWIQDFTQKWRIFKKIYPQYPQYRNALKYFNKSIIEPDADFAQVFLFPALETLIVGDSNYRIGERLKQTIEYFYKHIKRKIPISKRKLENLYSTRIEKLHTCMLANISKEETISYQQIFRDIMKWIIENNISKTNGLDFETVITNKFHNQFCKSKSIDVSITLEEGDIKEFKGKSGKMRSNRKVKDAIEKYLNNNGRGEICRILIENSNEIKRNL